MRIHFFFRTTALFLIFLMLLTAVACGKGNVPAEPTTAMTTSAAISETALATNEVTTAATTLYADNLPADLNYNGEVVTFIYREEIAGEFWAESVTGDIVNDAIHKSILSVEERLGVDIQAVLRKGHTKDVRTEYNNHIINQIMAGDDTYDWVDMMVAYSGGQAQTGAYCNLLTLNHLDLEQPWYISGLEEDISIADRLFFVIGDASLGYLKSAFCIYYNRDLAKNLQVEDMEALALDGKWTFEKVMQIAQQGAQDLNGDGKYDLSDQLGFVSHDSNHPRGFIGSTGMHLMTKKEDGSHAYTFGSDRDHAVCTVISTLQNDTPGSYFFNGSNSTPSKVSDYNQISEFFVSGRILMITAEMDDVIACGYHTMEDEYGVLPYPKYEENQAQYSTLSRTIHNSFLMPITCPDPEMAAAVLEALGSSKYATVMPTYFETALKTKYSYDTTASKIFDIIHDSMGLEFGYVYSNTLNSAPIAAYTNVLKNINSFASSIKAQGNMIGKLYDKMIETIHEKCE